MKELQPVINISVQGQIKDNLSELESWVNSVADKYKDLVVTDVADGKDVLKNLRALVKTINDEKIRVKKLFMTPYDEIEEKVKTLINIINSSLKPIEDQIKKAEQRICDQRKVKILELLEDEAKSTMGPKAYHFAQSVPWLFDTKWTQESFWTNNGNPAKKLKDAITEVIKRCESGVSSILMVGGEFTDQVLELFRVSGSLGNALGSLDEMKKARERAKQLKVTEESVVEEFVEDIVEEIVEEDVFEETQASEEEIPEFMRELQEVVTPNDIEIPSDTVPFMMDPEGVKPEKDVRKSVTIRFSLSDAELQELEGLFALTGVTYEVLG